MGNKRTEYANKKNKLHYYQRTFKFHNSLHMQELLNEASKASGKTVQAFVTGAIFDAAEKLGLETKRNCQDETADADETEDTEN